VTALADGKVVSQIVVRQKPILSDWRLRCSCVCGRRGRRRAVVFRAEEFAPTENPENRFCFLNVRVCLRNLGTPLGILDPTFGPRRQRSKNDLDERRPSRTRRRRRIAESDDIEPFRPSERVPYGMPEICSRGL